MSSMPDPLAFATEVAAYGLPGTRRMGWTTPIPDAEWPRYLRALLDYRLTGLATAALETGWIRLRRPQEVELLQSQRDAMTWALTLDQSLLEVARALEEIGIVALKGSSVAHTIYPDPAWRCYGDIDLLVRTDDFTRACELLHRIGFARLMPEPRAGFSERFGKAATHERDGIQVDLHRTLAEGPFGIWVDVDELTATATTFRLGDQAMPRLSDPAMLLHVALHAALGSAPSLLGPLRDVAQMTLQAGTDWAAVSSLAKRWKLEVVTGFALREASERLGFTLPTEAQRIAQVQVGRDQIRALRAFTTGSRTRGGTVLATARALPGVRSRARYARSLLFPSRDFLAARSGNGSASGYIKRWTIPLRWFARARASARGRPIAPASRTSNHITQPQSERSE